MMPLPDWAIERKDREDQCEDEAEGDERVLGRVVEDAGIPAGDTGEYRGIAFL